SGLPGYWGGSVCRRTGGRLAQGESAVREVLLMRFVSLGLAALCILLGTGVKAQAQAGRYIPAPRFPSGGGGSSFSPHVPFLHGSGGDLFWVIVAIVAIIVLAAVGWQIGLALGRRGSPG